MLGTHVAYEALEIAEQHPIGGFHQFKLTIRPDAIDDAHICESHHPINAFVGRWRHLVVLVKACRLPMNTRKRSSSSAVSEP